MRPFIVVTVAIFLAISAYLIVLRGRPYKPMSIPPLSSPTSKPSVPSNYYYGTGMAEGYPIGDLILSLGAPNGFENDQWEFGFEWDGYEAHLQGCDPLAPQCLVTYYAYEGYIVPANPWRGFTKRR